MGEVSTIGLDIAKSVFQVHGVDDTGTVVMRKRINRSKVCSSFTTYHHAWSGSKLAYQRISELPQRVADTRALFACFTVSSGNAAAAR
jgi:hypothetical protein